MTRNELEAHYRRYITCLNERQLDEAESFYCAKLLYNGKHISRATWREKAIEESIAAMPDLQWDIEALVIENEHLAARLTDSGTLVTEWQGIAPTGKQATFGENVLYRFRNEQICEVWSIVDVMALQPSPKS